MLSSLLKIYGFPPAACIVKPFGNGLINTTWVMTYQEQTFIIQKINDTVFTNPFLIAENLHLLNEYFKKYFPQYFFVHPVATPQTQEIVFLQGQGYYRMFPFVKGSATFDSLDNAGIAFEGARQFGKFTNLLAAFDITTLNITLQNFHNLSLRYQQFEIALENGNRERIEGCKDSIQFIKDHKDLVDTFNAIQTNPNFRKRVTHHDTKISNVLFDEHGKGLCVIDLDTVMPGYFISDAGDMIRTYVSPVSEEEKDFSKIHIREDYFKAIVDGYLSEMKDELSDEEKSYFVYAGKFMIYMQAIRFLSDHINNDIYYGAKYEGHNLTRCNNQLELLRQLISKEDALQAQVAFYYKKPGIIA